MTLNSLLKSADKLIAKLETFAAKKREKADVMEADIEQKKLDAIAARAEAERAERISQRLEEMMA